MNNLYKRFDLDAETEKSGVWLNLGEISDSDPREMRIRVRRAGGANTEFSTAMDEAMRPYRVTQPNEAQAKKMMHKLFAETIVAGWENIPDENGNLIDFTTDTCIDLFNRLPELFQLVRRESANLDLFRRNIRESAAKN